MKRFVLFFIAVLFPAMLFAQASISFDAEVFDAGTVAPGNPIEHVFVVTNTGDGDLVIEKIAAS